MQFPEAFPRVHLRGRVLISIAALRYICLKKRPSDFPLEAQAVPLRDCITAADVIRRRLLRYFPVSHI